MKRIVMAGALVLGMFATPAFAQNDASAQPRSNDGGGRGLMIALAAGSASLQAYDAYSTLTAIRGGASEANPLMKGIAQKPTALVAMKTGIAATSIYAGTALWKQHHRGAAIALMVATNSAMAVVAAHNASVLRSMGR